MEHSAASIQWFPGHMAKTRRLIGENLKQVDLVVELRDARIPHSSGNPEIKRLLGQKPRIVLLNKSDTADPQINRRWCDYYRDRLLPALAVDCRSGKGLEGVSALVRETLGELLARWKERGMVGRTVRLMVVGVPNVGKSSFINRMAGGRHTKVEDRPGVTRGKQWVKVEGGFELLDMPGVLWPRFDDPLVGENLALTGAIKDDVLDLELLAARLLERLWGSYPGLLEQRYHFLPEEAQGLSGPALLALAGKKRGMLLPGGEFDTLRAAVAVLDEFRGGKIGRISLERPGSSAFKSKTEGRVQPDESV